MVQADSTHYLPHSPSIMASCCHQNDSGYAPPTTTHEAGAPGRYLICVRLGSGAPRSTARAVTAYLFCVVSPIACTAVSDEIITNAISYGISYDILYVWFEQHQSAHVHHQGFVRGASTTEFVCPTPAPIPTATNHAEDAGNGRAPKLHRRPANII